MVYADWTYYTDEFKGIQITEQEIFDSFAVRASALIDSMTMSRAEPYHLGNPDPVKKATCAVVDALHRFSLATMDTSTGHGPVVSEKNDGFAVNYAEPVNPDSIYGLQSMNRRLYAEAEMYLRWTGLLYSGVALCAPTLT